MKARCDNPNVERYPEYGGRGIAYDPRWATFEPFLADVGEAPEGTSLDRIDPDGNYEQANCRWATPQQQARNQRKSRYITAFGRTMTMADWAEELGIRRSTISERLRRGQDGEQALRKAQPWRTSASLPGTQKP